MSAYKSFAVIGAGTLGLPILNALATKNVSVILLSRPESATKEVPSGVQVVKVDYLNDAAATGAAFKQHKVDVVLSTVGAQGIEGQKVVVEAAKIAGVRLFVPSEYGMPTEGHTQGFFVGKNQVVEASRAAGIPALRIYTGAFTEFIPWITGYSETGKIRIVGKGNAPASFTSIPDVAGFVAYVLTTLPPSELENRTFRLEGDRATLNEVGAKFNTTVEYADEIAGEAGDIKTYLLKLVDGGACSTGWDPANNKEGSGSEAAGSANKLWAGHQWKSIKDVHKL